MYRHKDIIEIPSSDAEYAKVCVEELLKSYQKQDISIGEVKLTENKRTKVSVEFSDNYEEVCYPKKDYVQIDDGNGLHP